MTQTSGMSDRVARLIGDLRRTNARLSFVDALAQAQQIVASETETARSQAVRTQCGRSDRTLNGTQIDCLVRHDMAGLAAYELGRQIEAKHAGRSK